MKVRFLVLSGLVFSCYLGGWAARGHEWFLASILLIPAVVTAVILEGDQPR